MTDNSFDGSGDAGKGDAWGLMLAAIAMVIGGLALMVWEDSRSDSPPTPFSVSELSR